MSIAHGYRRKSEYRPRRFELFEVRRLLAVNLIATQDPVPDAIPGQEISFAAHVSNFGGDDAINAKIEADLSDVLANPIWTRHMAYEAYIDAEALREHAHEVLVQPSTEGPTPVGDINDDGFVDFARVISQEFEQDGLSHVEVAFGTDEGLPADAFEAFNGTKGFIVEPFPRGYQFGIDLAGGDVNGDGLDDLIIGEGGVGDCTVPGDCPIVSTFASTKDGGAMVIFGSSDIGGVGKFVPSASNHLPTLETAPVAGAGSIRDELNIPTGIRVSYQIRGEAMAEANEMLLAAILQHGQFDEQPSNNFSPGLELAQLDVEVLQTPPESAEIGDRVSWRFRIHNGGPARLTHAILNETLSADLENPMWTRVDNSFPEEPIVPSHSRQGVGEALQLGGYGITLGDPRETFFFSYQMIDLKPIGDVDDDGFDDIVLRSAQCGANFNCFSFGRDNTSIFGSGKFGGFQREQLDLRMPNRGEFYPEVRSQTLTDVGNETVAALGDLNDDGIDDFAHHSLRLRKPVIRLGNRDGNLETLSVPAASNDKVASAGDFNGDGVSDLLILQQEPALTHVVFGGELLAARLAGALNVESSIRFRGSGEAIGDLNGDGATELRFGNKIVFGGEHDWIAEGISIDDLDPTVVLAIEVSGEEYRIDATASGDFNGDGIEDLTLLGRPVETFPGELDGLLEFRWQGHTTVFGNAVLPVSIDILSEAAAGNYALVPQSKLGEPGDLDGDGVDELLLYQDVEQTGLAFTVPIALSGAASAGAFGLPAQLRLQGHIGQLASGLDMNGDGLDELIVVDREDNGFDAGTGHVIGGRIHGTSSGHGTIDGILNIPNQATVEFTVTGNLAVPLAAVSGTVRVQLAEHQLFLTADGVERAVTQEFVSGDVDGDGIVNLLDLQILATNFGKQEVNRKDGDLDGDGAITFSDFLVLSVNFNRGTA